MFIGGSAGGGKTKALIMDGLRARARLPRPPRRRVSPHLRELREQLLAELTECGFAASLGVSGRGDEYEFRFPNGSMITFRDDL